jgi:hypothetical protein
MITFSSVTRRTGMLLMVSALTSACAAAGNADFVQPVAPADVAGDRMIIRSGDLVVSVDPAVVEGTAREVGRLVTEVGGYVERARIHKNSRASLQCRIPAVQLEQIMDRVADLGEERRRSISAADVTEEYTDLEARLRSSIALRGRLHQLLDLAKNVQEALAIERELTRIQAEIEAMQSRLDRMKSEVELASLSVTIEPKRILGPVSYVWYGIWWGVSKLFLIR